MKKLLFKLFILTLPLQLIMGYFIFADPMKLFFNNENPVSKGVLMNDRFYQIEYLQSKPKTYNSFIFGSSRSKAFKTNYWKKHLTKHAIPYHMGVNDESLYGIVQKLRYLDQNGYRINNVFIQMDPRLLSQLKNSEAHVFRDHYLVSGETKTAFYQRFFTAFLNLNFLTNYIHFKRTGEIQNKNQNVFLWDPGFIFTPSTGDIFYKRSDIQIKQDSLGYYDKLALHKRKRKENIAPKLLNNEAKQMLIEMQHIFKKNNTHYCIIISPNFDLTLLDPSDKKYLQQLFGVNFYDFSGKNQFTQTLGNYYEEKHFRPRVASHIIDSIYGE